MNLYFSLDKISSEIPKSLQIAAVYNNGEVAISIIGKEGKHEGITLTAEETDLFIAGLLERRGLSVYRLCQTEHDAISSDSIQQSEYSPANKNSNG